MELSDFGLECGSPLDSVVTVYLWRYTKCYLTAKDRREKSKSAIFPSCIYDNFSIYHCKSFNHSSLARVIAYRILPYLSYLISLH